ncbi:MAG TPA: hypothetical protein VIG95_01375 [Gemmatimonadales bacterium]
MGQLFAALLIPAACAHHRAETAGADAEIVLTIENHHWNDVVVSVLHDGVVDRLGLVQAVKTSRLLISSRRLSNGLIQLRAHAVGAPDDHTTETFSIRPGQEIQWTLESDLSRSSVAVH